LGSISEWGQYEYARARDYEQNDGPLPAGVHYIRIDLNDGREAIKSAFARWVDERTQRKQGRTWKKKAVDRLNALAAWRAQRAGLTHAGYLKLRTDIFGLEADRDKSEDHLTAPSALKKIEGKFIRKKQGGPAYATPRDFEKAWKDAEKELIKLKRFCVLNAGT